MRRYLPLLLVAILGTAFLLGRAARTEMGVELSAESLLAWVEGLGWQGPAIFVALVTFRQFLLLPSALLLSVGGLCFGALAGTGLGAVGIVLSAFMKFSLARWLGREWVRSQLGPGFDRFERGISDAGPVVVGAMTAHPMGLMSPFHWAAGLSSIPVLGFTAAVILGGPMRAGAYSLLGASLLDWGTPRFYLIMALFLGVLLLPLAHPGVRRRLGARLRSRATGTAEP